jgi:hypothetical protein
MDFHVKVDLDFLKDPKIMSTVMSSLVFVLVAQPKLYSVTNKYFNVNSMCPTNKTKLLHTVVFFCIIFAMITYNKDKQLVLTEKSKLYAKWALFGSLIFFLLSSTEMYTLTQSITKIKNIECPDLHAIIIHSVVYGIILYTIMNVHETA